MAAKAIVLLLLASTLNVALLKKHHKKAPKEQENADYAKTTARDSKPQTEGRKPTTAAAIKPSTRSQVIEPVKVPALANPSPAAHTLVAAEQRPPLEVAAPANPATAAHTKGAAEQRPPLDAAATKKGDDPAIMKIDNLSKGKGKIQGTMPAINISECESMYKPDETPNLNLKVILDDIIPSLPLLTSSRGFIDPTKFVFQTEQQRNASIVISSCEGRRSLKLLNLKSSNSLSPLKWLKIGSMSIDVVELLYDEAINKKNGTAWNAMEIKGVGRVSLGNAQNKLNNEKYLIIFEKSMNSPGKPELVDTDMTIRIENSINDRYEMKATDFLEMHGKNVNDLYPKGTDVKIDCLTNEELTVEQKHGNSAIIRGSVGERNTYMSYMTGNVKYCMDLPGSDIDLICESDFLNNINCALLAIIDTSTNKKYKTFQKSGLNNIGDVVLTDVAEKSNLFLGRIPDKLLFQTSRNAISSLNDDLQTRLYPYITNDNKRDPQSPSQTDVIPNFCFRYKLDNVGSKFPNLRNSLNTQMLVNVCPEPDSIKFYLPDIGLIPIDQIPLLMTAFPEEIKFIDFFKEQTMVVSVIEVRESEADVGMYKYIFTLQPPAYKDTKGFAFIINFPFLGIEETPIVLTRDATPDVTIEGSGEEKILGAIASFKIEQDEIGPTMTAELEMTNSFFLMKAFKEVSGFPFITEECKNDSYITPFHPLKQFTLTSLGVTAHTGDDNLRFVGGALLGTESDIEFELHLSYTPEGKVKGRTCLFARDGDVSTFTTAVRGNCLFGQSWLKYSYMGVMYIPSVKDSKPNCAMDICCISNPDSAWAEKGSDRYVGLKIRDIMISHCGLNSNVSDGCKFLNRVFNKSSSIDVILTGFMTPDTISLSGTTENTMVLGPGVFISGNPPIKVNLAAIQTLKKKKDFLSFEGWLTFGNMRTNNLLSKIIISGDNVMLQILSAGESMPNLDIFDSGFVRLADTMSRRTDLFATSDLTVLELNAAIEVGYDPNNLITFDDKNMVRLFIDPETGKASKFYACKEGPHAVPIRDLLNAFNGEKVYGLLDNTEIKGLCLTYHGGKSKWNITELGLSVKPGLRLSGLLASHFSKGHPKGETFHLKVEMDLSIRGSSSLLCVSMPVLKWGVQERTVDGKKFESALMAMYHTESSDACGPDYCYNLPKQNGGTTEAYLRGYLKTFAFDTKATISIGSSDPRAPGNIFHYTYDYSGELFNEIEGRIKFEANYTQQDPFKINFQVTIDQLQLDGLQESLQQHTKDKFEQGQSIQDKAQGFFGKFSKWTDEINANLGKLKKQVKKQKDKFTKVRVQRAKAMQVFRRDCSNECGYVRVPGWTTNDKCGKTTTGAALRCMNYAEDAHVASNVGCVASCEAERVKSSEDAIKLDGIARVEGSNLDKGKSCLHVGGKLKEKVDRISNFLKDNAEKMKDTLNKFKSMKKLDTTKFQIKGLRASVNIAEMTDPTCFQFDWESVWDWDRDADKTWGVAKRRQTFLNTTRCFNGFFVKNITEYTMTKRYLVNQIMKMSKQVTQMDGKYFMFGKILDRSGGNSKSRHVNQLEDDFKKCCNDTNAKRNTERRSVIDTMTPLKGGMFTIFKESTIDSFNKRSPWVMANKKDAFQYFSTKRKVSTQNLTIPDIDSPCSVARRAAIDYNDIANYVHKWVKEQQSAKRTLSTVKTVVKDEMEKADKKIRMLETNSSKDAVQLMRHWAEKAKSGVTEWISAEEKRIAKYNSESMPIIRKELEFIYTGKQFPTLHEFFNQKMPDGPKSLKKTEIAAKDSNSFSQLSKSLQNILENGSNLDQLTSPIEDAIQRIESFNKRTIICMS